ncbi:MAG: hypothetical protein GF419_11740, partial [Ignavibacteriales bacterium]|nr:hypothetical protein [Ignavibacteriales bacterium]
MSFINVYRCAAPEAIIETVGNAEGSLLLAFASSKLDLQETVSALRRTGGRAVGCTTAGEIIGDENGARAYDGSIVVVEFGIDASAYDAKLFPLEGGDYREPGARVGEWAREKFANPVVFA